MVKIREDEFQEQILTDNEMLKLVGGSRRELSKVDHKGTQLVSGASLYRRRNSGGGHHYVARGTEVQLVRMREWLMKDQQSDYLAYNNHARGSKKSM